MSIPSNTIPTKISELTTDPAPSDQGWLVYVRDGVTYKVQAADIVSVSGVPTSRQVIAGTGMTGGGQLTGNVTLSIAAGGVGTTQLATTGVTAGSYGSATQTPVITVDAAGRVTAATSATISLTGYVHTSRQVTAGTGLTGGGTLGNDVTLAANVGSTVPLASYNSGSAGSSSELSRVDHKHPAVDLADDTEVDGLLGLDHGGTGRSITASAGAVIWCGADGLYTSPIGAVGQVLVSNGTAQPSWSNALTVSDQAANVVYAGPASGPLGPTGFRALVNADVPTTLTGKTISADDNTLSGIAASSFVLSNASGNLDGAAAQKAIPTGAVVGTTDTQTLTGKTLTSPTINGGTISGITDLAVADGGTGASTASGARTSLGVPATDGTSATGTWGISVTGNAATVTNGLYTTGSYADPAWLTSLAGSKITGQLTAGLSGGTF